MRKDKYIVVKIDETIYGVQYKDYPHIGIPESWGIKNHAERYLVSLMGLTWEEYKNGRF